MVLKITNVVECDHTTVMTSSLHELHLDLCLLIWMFFLHLRFTRVIFMFVSCTLSSSYLPRQVYVVGKMHDPELHSTLAARFPGCGIANSHLCFMHFIVVS